MIQEGSYDFRDPIDAMGETMTKRKRNETVN